jgi:hypothetical protein
MSHTQTQFYQGRCVVVLRQNNIICIEYDDNYDEYCVEDIDVNDSE